MYKFGHFKYIGFFIKQKLLTSLPTPAKRKKKNPPTPSVVPNFKKISKVSFYCTYMQRRKHIQLDLRVSFIPCRAKDYCEKRHRHRKKKEQQ